MKNIRIYAKEHRTSSEKGSRSFVKYSYTRDGKTYYQVKFNKTCKYVPTEQGYYLISFDLANVNLVKGKTLNYKGRDVKENDVLWIKDATFVRDSSYEESKKAEKAQSLAAIFASEDGEIDE